MYSPVEYWLIITHIFSYYVKENNSKLFFFRDNK